MRCRVGTDRQLQSMPALIPGTNGFIGVFSGKGITKQRMVCAVMDCLRCIGQGGKIRVCNPEGSQTAHLTEFQLLFPLDGIGTHSIVYLIKIVHQLLPPYFNFGHNSLLILLYDKFTFCQ